MSKQVFLSSELAAPVGPFSQAIKSNAYIFFSGQVGQDPTTGKLVPGGLEAETERVFKNLKAVLAATGKSFDDVVKVSVFLTRMSDFTAMNSIYGKYFAQPYPARTTVAVVGLPLGASVEIDLIVQG